MPNRLVESTQRLVRRLPLKSRLALLLVISSALGAFGWLWWSATERSKISFLPALAGADWIIYPKAAEGPIHPRMECATVFTRSFVLEEVSLKSIIKISGFYNYSISLNGQPLNDPHQRGSSWKTPDVYFPCNFLRRGTNEILVTASNTNGPPAIWLSLTSGNFSLGSDETWEASYAGAVWKHAHPAKEPLPMLSGNSLYGGERPGPAFLNRWPILLLFAVFSGLVAFSITRREKAGSKSKLKERLPLAIFIALWIGMFVNNLSVLPQAIGYDNSGHCEYIDYVETHWSLPLASEGWEMFQPPLYYVFCALLLKILSLTVYDSAGVAAVRLFGLVTGITHFLIVWKSLRLLFPDNRAKQNWGLLLAACLPPGLFLSHYISNEALAAVMVSGSVYLCLRILKQEQSSWKSFAGLGLCLGAALLAKSTAVLALLPIFGALVWKMIQRRGGTVQDLAVRKHSALSTGPAQIAVVAAICFLISGWHYVRTWYHFGSPIVGVWEPRTGFSWWQDNGYRTAAFYLRFGQVLFHPWFSALHSFADGFYSTLWGDGLMGGGDLLFSPPWNFDLMALGYWLALVPTAGVIIGAFSAIRQFVRQPSPEWFLLLGLSFLMAFALAYMSLTIPYYCVIKAFYGFSAFIPFCIFGACGLERMTNSPERGENQRNAGASGQLRAILISFLIGVWSLTSIASFWIVHSSVQTLLSNAALMKENHPVEAQRLLERRLAVEPENWRVRADLAKCLIANTNEERALKEASIVADAAPDYPQNLTTLAAVLALKNPELAIEQAERARRIAPGYILPYEQVATLHQLQGHYAEAEAAAREGLALEPFNSVFNQTLGEALVRRGQIAEGILLLKTACQLRPENVLAYISLAEAYELQHVTTEAIAAYQEVLRLRPDMPSVVNNLAWLRATDPREQFRDGAEAVRLAERACELTQYKQPIFIGTLGAAYAEAGRFEEAVKTATQARDLARAAGLQDLAEKNEELIKLFSNRQPYRQAQ
jgi:tetratricopeptide (TPR) repeat protein